MLYLISCFLLNLFVPTLTMEEQTVYGEMMQMSLPSVYVSEEMLTYHVNEEEENTNFDIYAQLEMENENALQSVLQEGLQGETQEGVIQEVIQEEVGSEQQEVAANSALYLNVEKLRDFDFLIKNYYQIDQTTTIGSDMLNVDKLLSYDVHVDKNASGPQILIYHTHSQETYADCVEGDATHSVVAVGEELARLLRENYGVEVLHHTGEYDVGDRDHAYSNVEPALTDILAQNPSIQMVIDLHRDGVAETTHLVTEINGKPTAQIMFFNGLCRTTARGELTATPNPYLDTNLALSFQLQMIANEKYPGFTRRIYLKGYRYNMHMCPKSLLIEVGAQTNTFEEAMNAMEPLSEVLGQLILQ